MKTLKGLLKSQESKVINANKANLSASARQVYLQGIACLSKAENVAMRGNQGKGFKTQFLFSEPKKTKV